MKNLIFFCSKLVLALILTVTSVEAFSQNQFFLFRHAEKQANAGSDPKLTDAGIERAERIAQLLKNTKIDKIYSTNYQRTLLTAKPLAEVKDLKVEIYDPRKLKEFAQSLKALSGSFVIVGHSNTTPQLTTWLGETEIEPMNESEYGVLYLVTQSKDSSVVIELSTD